MRRDYFAINQEALNFLFFILVYFAKFYFAVTCGLPMRTYFTIRSPNFDSHIKYIDEYCRYSLSLLSFV